MTVETAESCVRFDISWLNLGKALMSSTDVALDVFKVLLIPVGVAWVAAVFGFRRGLQQARQEHAFDRSLEWHERTIRAMSRFSDSAWQLENTLVFSKIPSEAIKRFLIVDERATELDQTLEESVLFTDRKTVIQLREDVFGLGELLSRLQDTRSELDPDDPDILEKIEDASNWAIALAKTFRERAFSLSQKIRAELGLEAIEADDLKSEFEKAAEKSQTGSR